MSQKIEELLLRWEERRRIGKPASVEELCRDCPELREQLRTRVKALEKMNQVLDLKSYGTAPTNGRPRTRYDDLRPNLEPIPGYRLEKRLGKGGFGEVWKATGPGGFAVALKFVSLNGSLGTSEVRSLEVIKTLHHPNLLATFGSWQANGFLVIAMELADKTLLDRLNEAVAQGQSGIPGDELIRYMQDAAKGIDYLNQPDGRVGDSTKAAVQHRDIKPQNILLMGGGIKIGDFGLLRILKTTVTQENGSLTLAYAAPEFLSGRAALSSDQYSLAVTYCHLRGGRLPFVGHAGQVMEGHLKRPPDLSMLPKTEMSAVARALEKDPSKRWATCTEFIRALTNGIDPGDSSPGSATRQPLQKLFGGRRIHFAALALLVLTAIVGCVIAWRSSGEAALDQPENVADLSKKKDSKKLDVPGDNAKPPVKESKASDPLEDLRTAELERLRGTWTRTFQGGKTYDRTVTVIKMRIENDLATEDHNTSFQQSGRKTSNTYSWKIVIDPTKSPKWLNKQGDQIFGFFIYELKGNELTISGGGTRPTGFDPKQSVTWRRE